MQLGLIFNILGRFLCLIALGMVPSIFVASYEENYVVMDAFMLSAAVALMLGVFILLATRGAKPAEKLTRVMLGLVLSAICVAFVAGLPIALLSPENTLVMALFNGMSMLTTTGVSSLYAGVIPKAIVLWQAIMGWFGGFLAIVIGLSILHVTNSGGMQLHKSPLPHGLGEGTYNRFSHSFKTLLPFYLLATVLGFFALLLGPMTVFDSFVRALSGISTHGFDGVNGTNAVYGYWSQFVMVLLMLFGALNMDYHYGWFKLNKRNIYVQDSESISYIKFMALAFAIFWVLAFLSYGRDAFSVKTLWDGLFIVTTMMSTTGLSLPDMQAVTLPGVGVLLVSLVVLGGCVISSAGGVKIMRFVIVLRHLKQELFRIAQPHGVATIRYARAVVAQKDIDAVWLLGSGFLLLIVFGTVALAVLGVPFEEALPMAVASSTTTGPLVEFISPSFPGYAHLMLPEYAVLSFLMLFGRIEVSILLGLMVRALWRE